MRFCFTDQVYLSARDVRQFQLAKAAIRAGAETLLEQAGKTPDDLSALVIAGGFGNFMDKQSALAVGLLPPMDSGRIRYVGNAAGAGAALALTAAGRMQLQTFCEKCSYVELSGSPVFMEKYVECMAFENAVEE